MEPKQPEAVAHGGPLDGTVLGEAQADHVDVLMADGTRHRYVRSVAEPSSSRVRYDHVGRTG